MQPKPSNWEGRSRLAPEDSDFIFGTHKAAYRRFQALRREQRWYVAILYRTRLDAAESITEPLSLWIENMQLTLFRWDLASRSVYGNRRAAVVVPCWSINPESYSATNVRELSPLQHCLDCLEILPSITMDNAP
jgi:hypothetical protein